MRGKMCRKNVDCGFHFSALRTDWSKTYEVEKCIPASDRFRQNPNAFVTGKNESRELICNNFIMFRLGEHTYYHVLISRRK